jgi:hypothetical protein
LTKALKALAESNEREALALKSLRENENECKRLSIKINMISKTFF